MDTLNSRSLTQYIDTDINKVAFLSVPRVLVVALKSGVVLTFSESETEAIQIALENPNVFIEPEESK